MKNMLLDCRKDTGFSMRTDARVIALPCWPSFMHARRLHVLTVDLCPQTTMQAQMLTCGVRDKC